MISGRIKNIASALLPFILFVTFCSGFLHHHAEGNDTDHSHFSHCSACYISHSIANSFIEGAYQFHTFDHFLLKDFYYSNPFSETPFLPGSPGRSPPVSLS
jgi:hypothetical protein